MSIQTSQITIGPHARAFAASRFALHRTTFNATCLHNKVLASSMAGMRKTPRLFLHHPCQLMSDFHLFPFASYRLEYCFSVYPREP